MTALRTAPTAVTPGPRARGRRTLLLLAALFFVPLAAAFLLYYGSDWRPGGTTNHGTLIVPARPLPAVPLRTADGTPADRDLFHRRWTLAYVGDGRCDPACRAALLTIRQTRLALGKDMDRVRRVFLASGACCDRDFLAREHAGLTVLDASDAATAGLIATFPADERTHAIFVVDPLGNLMMRFDDRGNPKGLLQDLKKLLLLSQVG